MNGTPTPKPGPLVLFGSGETLPTSGKAHEFIAKRISDNPKISILETPAGFEPNSPQVAGNVGDFLSRRLQNFNVSIDIIPARKKGSEFSPDNKRILKPMLTADWIFMGPGSPTYAVRQLKDSIAYQYLWAKQRLGTPITFASAAILAISAFTLPVYEIYKVGEELHWKQGLNFLNPYGLDMIFIPHWNNTDGGENLDTSRCYVGKARFESLLNLLNSSSSIVGIDEHTALIIDFEDDCGCVLGTGGVTVIKNGVRQYYQSGSRFDLTSLGKYQIPSVNDSIPDNIAVDILSAEEEINRNKSNDPSQEIVILLEAREAARSAKNWTEADLLREKIANEGWLIQDTPNGPQLIRQENGNK